LIILDTGVISEIQKKIPNEAVMAWLDAQDSTNLYLTAITAAELLFGVRSMPEGRRRDGLTAAITAILDEDFADRILPFDGRAAAIYGERVSAARGRGFAITIADGQIASIALARPGAIVATRDTTPFIALGATVLDPWALGDPRRR
jgi:predicted nucleic acid-binding protein